MRKENEMYDLILKTAKENENILAVYMNGSRTNNKVKKDIFQDYDIVYVVKETKAFIEDKNWIKIFGEVIVSQEPDKNDKLLGRKIDFTKGYTYLMQFSDGNRIDLHLQPIDSMLKEYGSDKLTVPLLDKKQYLPQIEEASDEDYWVKKPSKEEFFCTCNEFWWVAPYCAKGLWREEILYSNDVLNSYVRIQLLKMLSWKAGIETNFKKSMGKSYKYLNKYIDKELWYQLVETYNLSSVDNTWNSLFKTCDLFNKVALEVSYKLNYSYNTKEAKQSSKFIRDIFELPKNAKNIY